jgi:phosphoadenosine phosphosulfate reductase
MLKTLKTKYQLAAQKLNTYKKLDFEQKLFLTNQRIEKALQLYDKPLVSSSFGKDSTVLIHLVMQHTTDFDVVFVETGVQFRETLEFRDFLTKEWNLRLHITKPEVTFWWCVEKKGFPKQSRNSKTGDRRQPFCCKELKEKPMQKFIKTHDFNLNFVGLLADEGRQRRWAYIQKGCCIYEHKYWGVAKCIPLIWWSEQDIWKYIKKFELPVNPAYEKYGIKRTGCVPCTGHIDWQKSMGKANPKMLKYVIRLLYKKDMKQLTDFPQEVAEFT